MDVCSLATKKSLRELGRGEQAVVYEVDKDALKITNLKSTHARKIWLRETQFQARLAGYNIAPHIRKSRLCAGEKEGAILMERIGPTLQKRLGGKGACLRGVNAARLIELLQMSIEAGILHMDNHADNIAFTTKGKPILIDFGFSVDVTRLSLKGQQVALVFSVWQIVEHMTTACWRKSKDIVRLVEEGSAAIGIPLPYTGKPALDFKRILPEWPELARALANYNAIMHLTPKERYDTKEYDDIYEFRQKAPGL